jgi:hypothetical protein
MSSPKAVVVPDGGDGASVPMVSTRIAILPSPLLGPATYEPLAASLTARGARTVVAPLPEDDVAPEGVLAAFHSTVADHGATVVVAHSNAGYYAPKVGADLDLPVLFVDAALPAQDVTETLLAPAAFAEFIGSLPVTDGRLPSWPSWWERAELARLFPDSQWLDRVTREAPRLAPSYFTTSVPVPRGWAARPAAYLAFGETYAAELAFARHAGWVVRREDGHHLAHLADPDHVADLVGDMLTDLAKSTGKPSESALRSKDEPPGTR